MFASTWLVCLVTSQSFSSLNFAFVIASDFDFFITKDFSPEKMK